MKKEETAVVPDETQAVMPEAGGMAAAETTEMPEAAATETAPEASPDAMELEELRRYKAAMEEANQVIMDVLDAEPVLAKIIQDISMGATFREAIARHIDPEDLVAQQGDPDFEAWEKNRTARSEELGKRKEMQDKLDANKEMTEAEIKAFREEMGYSEEQMLEFMGQLDELFTNVYAGLIDRKTMRLLQKAINADQMVAEAKQEGEIEGRNAKIKETIAPTKVGDGLPKVAATETPVQEAPPKKKGYIENLLNKS